MATLNSTLTTLLGGSSTGASDATSVYFALALSDSKDGYVTIQIDDETMMEIFLEEDEVEANPIEDEQNDIDEFYDEMEDYDISKDEEEDNESDVDDRYSSDVDDEEA